MDDIEDQAEIRNGKPCWHLCTDVIQAINDVSMLRSFLQEMLRQNLDTKMYVNALDIFNEIYTHITIGQQIDYEMSRRKKYDSFTESAYNDMNDFADCFIEDSITGNSGTDIGKGKFTWLSMAALQRGPDQMEAIGRGDQTAEG
ncbi:unnamed protein product, partial [Iphiclides podalirius]